MSWIPELFLFMGILFALLLGGLWVPFSIGVAGVVSIYLVDGITGFRALGLVTWGTVNSFTLTAIPLFILMAEILQISGVGARFYRGLAYVVRPLPGGLLQTNVASCAMFSAISGSSVATAAVMATVSVPQMDAEGYDRSRSAGSLAAGGTLGILIPPSIPLIIYGAFTETSIVKLFMAGFVPGFLLALLFMLFIAGLSLLRPLPLRPTTQTTGRTLLGSLVELIPLMVLMFVVLGSIYTGFATPTEAAALGCAIATIVGAIWGRLTFMDIHFALRRSIQTSATLLFIVSMAFIFSYGVENAGLGSKLTEAILGLGLGKYSFLLTVIVLFLVLGCTLESVAMMVLTVPLLFGSVVSYGFDPIWFGIILVLLLEFGMLTPPFGINLFVIQGASKYPLSLIVKGTVPYWFLILGFVGLLTVFPEIVLFLPEMMSG
ncbi:MAG: TRAP transporter large permease [Jhaorihella sp.]